MGCLVSIVGAIIVLVFFGAVCSNDESEQPELSVQPPDVSTAVKPKVSIASAANETKKEQRESHIRFVTNYVTQRFTACYDSREVVKLHHDLQAIKARHGTNKTADLRIAALFDSSALAERECCWLEKGEQVIVVGGSYNAIVDKEKSEVIEGITVYRCEDPDCNSMMRSGVGVTGLWFPVDMLTKSKAKASTSNAPEKAAIKLISDRLGSNHYGIEADDLRSMKNPKGKGSFVYVEKTRYHGTKRNIIWMVIDGKAYPLNGSTQGIITPTLPWPREAPNSSWEKTGLDKYMATEAIEIVWGKQ